MFGLLLACGVAAAVSGSPGELLTLESAGVSGQAPVGWKPDEGASSAEAAVRGDDGRLWISTTPYQLPVAETVAAASGKLASQRLYRLGTEEVSVTRTAVEEVAGRSTNTVEARGLLKGKEVVLVQRSVPVAAAMVHVSALAANRDRAAAAVDAWLASMSAERPPQDLSALPREVSSPEGVAITLPEGWRPPLDGEKAAAEKLLAVPDPTRCWLAIQPTGDGGTGLLQGCPAAVDFGVVDEHSLAAVDARVRQAVFGGPAAEFAAPTLDTATGRPVLTYTLPSQGKNAVMVAVSPTGAAAFATWAVGPKVEQPALATTLSAAVAGARYPDATWAPTAAHQVDYVLQHRLDLLAMVLTPFALGAALLFRKLRPKKSWELDDHHA